MSQFSYQLRVLMELYSHLKVNFNVDNINNFFVSKATSENVLFEAGY